MSETAFCPAPHCQRQRPYTVGEDGMRRCGYCRKELGMEEVLGTQTEMAMEPVLSRLARLEMRADAAAKTDQDISAWVGRVQGQIEPLEVRVHGQAAAINALLTRVTALEAAVAAEIAPLPSMPASPPGGKSKSRAKKTPPRYPIKKR